MIFMKRLATRTAQWGLLLVLAGLTVYPFLFLFINSFKDIATFYREPWWFNWPLQLENYTQAWLALAPFIVNSIVVCVTSTAIILVAGLLSGFAFARYEFPGKGAMYMAILAMMMVPAVLMIVPSFLLARDLSLLDSYWVMILFYVAGGQVIAMFLFRNAIESIPEDLFHAAAIDGAGIGQVLRHVVVPLSKSVIGTVAILSMIATWNNFLWPLVTINDASLKVVTNGILEFSSSYGANYGTMFAGYIISAVPMLIIILLAMRSFMQGVTAGAMKE